MGWFKLWARRLKTEINRDVGQSEKTTDRVENGQHSAVKSRQKSNPSINQFGKIHKAHDTRVLHDNGSSINVFNPSASTHSPAATSSFPLTSPAPSLAVSNQSQPLSTEIQKNLPQLRPCYCHRPHLHPAAPCCHCPCLATTVPLTVEVLRNHRLYLYNQHSKANYTSMKSRLKYEGEMVTEREMEEIDTILKNWKDYFDHSVKMIELIQNEDLEIKYNEINGRLEGGEIEVGEMFMFHGTSPWRVQKIMKEGFKVGGVDGIEACNGSQYRTGVYTSPFLVIPIQFSSATGTPPTRQLIALRCIAAKQSPTQKFKKDIKEERDKISKWVNRDAETRADVVVLRSGRQSLPLYVIHFEVNVWGECMIWRVDSREEIPAELIAQYPIVVRKTKIEGK